MDESLRLDIAEMDRMHDEFIELLENTKSAAAPEFMARFEALIEHTQGHFAAEEAMMEERAFYGLAEHRGEHETLLEEMRYFFEKGRRLPPFARSYIDDYAYEKFRRHIVNIDSQLAMFLKGSGGTA